ncbi:ABC transporter substrate-binding protein [Nocardioides sp. J9]|uniref:ABC transporter substrate-binding protein n=1 Tax=Nocardioides sp. J9 TaxID=935844 RepID=UPI001646656B|nr:ABC transporter substrate-binding protein [Nocardioides sp. J9]
MSSESGYLRGDLNPEAPLYDKLPAAIRDAGEIRLGTTVGYPPYEFEDKKGNLIGYEPDLTGVLSAELGVPIRWVDAPYAALYPGLESGRFDVLMAGAAVTQERVDLYDPVTYLEGGSALVVPTGNPEGIDDVDDLCGHTIAVVTATSQETFLTDTAETCSGDAPLEILSLESDTSGLLQIRQQRADGLLASAIGASYYVKTSDGAFEMVLPDIEPGLFGLVAAPDDPALGETLAEGFNGAIESGTYADVLAKWQMDELAIDTSEVDPTPN